MKTDVDSGLLERLRKIGSILKGNVAEGERLKSRLTPSAAPAC